MNVGTCYRPNVSNNLLISRDRNAIKAVRLFGLLCCITIHSILSRPQRFSSLLPCDLTAFPRGRFCIWFSVLISEPIFDFPPAVLCFLHSSVSRFWLGLWRAVLRFWLVLLEARSQQLGACHWRAVCISYWGNQEKPACNVRASAQWPIESTI